MAPDRVACHAACVGVGAAGVLIRGPPGSGKSSLALLLADALGAALVADDRVLVEALRGRLVARPHLSVAGLVEVRGQGILSAADLGVAVLSETTLALAVDLMDEAARLPEPPTDLDLLGVALPRLVLDRGARAAGLAPMLIRARLRQVLA